MSGEEPVGRPAEPMDLTDEEVAELAGRRSRPVAAVARMRKRVPSDATGRLVSDRSDPARVSKDEVVGMRRAGRRPDQVLRRLTPSDVAADAGDGGYDDRLAGPSRKPGQSKSR